jgi:uncharacterized membrane protein
MWIGIGLVALVAVVAVVLSLGRASPRQWR